MHSTLTLLMSIVLLYVVISQEGSVFQAPLSEVLRNSCRIAKITRDSITQRPFSPGCPGS